MGKGIQPKESLREPGEGRVVLKEKHKGIGEENAAIGGDSK
jgi:hypothetical protein